jgi:hypothetical protein
MAQVEAMSKKLAESSVPLADRLLHGRIEALPEGPPTPEERKRSMAAKTKRVRCRSGLTGWQSGLRDNYESFEHWVAYAEVWGLHFKLGFKTPQTAWRANPVVQGSVSAADYCKVVGGRRLFQRQS